MRPLTSVAFTLCALAVGAFAPTVRADVIWNFGSFGGVQSEQDLGTTATFTQTTSLGNKNIIASGFLTMNYQGHTPGPLALHQKDYQKTTPTDDEEGLGLTVIADHELSLDPGTGLANSMIQLDVTSIMTFGNGRIAMGSVQPGSPAFDKWDLWGSNTPGLTGLASATKLLPARTDDLTFVSIPSWGSYQYIMLTEAPDATNTTGNALVFELSVTDSQTQVPEPAALSLLALGGLALFARRK